MEHQAAARRSPKEAAEQSINATLDDATWERIEKLAEPSTIRGIALYLNVYLAIAAMIAAALYFDHPLVTALAVILIAGRQHSLYILNHDAAHYGLFKSAAANKFAGTLLSNLVMFHHPSAWSYVQWRRVHRFHHTDLFTHRDPNYVDRINCGDTRRAPSVGGLLWICLKAGLAAPLRLFTARQDYVPPRANHCENGAHNHLRTLLLPFADDPELERERRIKLVFFAAAFALIGYFELWIPFLTFWILPMYLVYPMILAFMDHTEHRWTESTEELDANSRSVRLGVIARSFISFLPRGLHREHHVYQDVIAAKLPELSTILCDASGITPPLRGLPALLGDVAQRARI